MFTSEMLAIHNSNFEAVISLIIIGGVNTVGIVIGAILAVVVVVVIILAILIVVFVK